MNEKEKERILDLIKRAILCAKDEPQNFDGLMDCLFSIRKMCAKDKPIRAATSDKPAGAEGEEWKYLQK